MNVELNKISFNSCSKTKWACFSIHIEMRGNQYRISAHLFAHKQGFEIEICKTTNNPFGGKVGKTYATWEEAIAAYKAPEMQAKLQLARADINAYVMEQEMKRLATNN